jgi:tetratricopeptide (TPR) repeat protein
LLLLKADVLISLKKFREALHILEKAEIMDSSDPSLFILKTDVFLALEMPEKAEQMLSDCLDQFDGEERVDILFELADVFDDYEDFQKVFDCLKLILTFDPLNEEALYKICFWTDYTGRNEESIKLHTKIIDAHPYAELAWFNLGAAFQGIKLYEKAIDAYQYAVAIEEKFDYAYRNMGDAYIKLRRYKEAIEVLEKVLELARPETVIFEAIGFCYDKQAKYAQARANYKKAVHLSPEDSQLFYKIGLTYMNEENWPQAIKSLEAALHIHVQQPEYNLAMGSCLMEMDRLEDALVYLGNVVRIKPRMLRGWTEILTCLYKGGLSEEGLQFSGLAFEQTDHKPIFLYFKAAFLLQAGKHQEAIALLHQAVLLAPRLVKQFIAIDPALLQYRQVVELLAGLKKRNKRG